MRSTPDLIAVHGEAYIAKDPGPGYLKLDTSTRSTSCPPGCCHDLAAAEARDERTAHREIIAAHVAVVEQRLSDSLPPGVTARFDTDGAPIRHPDL